VYELVSTLYSRIEDDLKLQEVKQSLKLQHQLVIDSLSRHIPLDVSMSKTVSVVEKYKNREEAFKKLYQESCSNETDCSICFGEYKDWKNCYYRLYSCFP
jgi:predicted DNA-binding protein YlxM (UPF0122 family)